MGVGGINTTTENDPVLPAPPSSSANDRGKRSDKLEEEGGSVGIGQHGLCIFWGQWAGEGRDGGVVVPATAMKLRGQRCRVESGVG